jgi:hypothetical protein
VNVKSKKLLQFLTFLIIHLCRTSSLEPEPPEPNRVAAPPHCLIMRKIPITHHQKSNCFSTAVWCEFRRDGRRIALTNEFHQKVQRIKFQCCRAGAGGAATYGWNRSRNFLAWLRNTAKFTGFSKKKEIGKRYKAERYYRI